MISIHSSAFPPTAGPSAPTATAYGSVSPSHRTLSPAVYTSGSIIRCAHRL